MWAVRGKCKYYYRYKRVRGRLERTYIGTGAKAEQAAAEDAAVRAQREAGFAARRIAQANREPADASVVELSSLAELIVNSNLLLAGYHQHDQGEWRRKRRGGKKECSRAKTSTVTGPGEPSDPSITLPRGDQHDL